LVLRIKPKSFRDGEIRHLRHPANFTSNPKTPTYMQQTY